MIVSIPFLDVAASFRELEDELQAAVMRVMRSGMYVLGPEVEEFERAFAAYCGASHCVGVGNGLDALHLTLRAMGVGPGDEVIVPSNTYIATWLAVSSSGATIVPVEPDERTYNIDPAKLARSITQRTKVVIAVHLYGQPADIGAIADVIRGRGIKLLEDAAQAQGARYRGERIGAHGDAVAWSFYPGKNLGAAGDAGAVTTNDAELASTLSLLRNYGSREKYVHEREGVNSRLDPLHAAVLRVKLEHLTEWNRRRNAIAQTYLGRLPSDGLVLPYVPQWAEPVWHLFVVRTKRRDELQRYLSQSGIATLIHYPTPPHLQHAYRYLGLTAGAYPISERIHEEVLSLPIGPHLPPSDVDRVIDAVERFYS